MAKPPVTPPKRAATAKSKTAPKSPPSANKSAAKSSARATGKTAADAPARSTPRPGAKPRPVESRSTATRVRAPEPAIPAPHSAGRSAAPAVPTGSFETILIVDLGSQYTQLIARRIRELNIHSDIVDNTITPEKIAKHGNVIGLILSGGPSSADKYGSPQIDARLLKTGVPILGICYGLQLVGNMLGGRLERAKRAEFGKTELWVEEPESTILFKGLNPNLICWMSHGDCLASKPRGARVVAHTDASSIAAFEYPEKNIYAVQFHPEVTHTPWGIDLLRNFVYSVCHAKGDWTMGNFVDLAVEKIRKRVGPHGEVICAVSGGVDSLCTAAIVDRAIGERLHPIFVDHGFLRMDEGDKVVEAWRGHFKSRLIRVNAAKRFLTALHKVSDPERKRKIIGREFIKVFDEESRKLKAAGFLAQGTLYPDVIESKGIGMHAQVIKTHHNVGGLPRHMKLSLIEPVRDLFKDEVRKLGVTLGLPAPMVYRQPFPGPGLAIRIIGEVTQERLSILRHADKIVRDEIEIAEMDPGERPWQYFAVLPAVKTVGVMGDQRTYGYPLVIRAVTSSDGMTADWSKLPYKALERISSRLIGEVRGINRVTLDITSKPPATIEWE